MKKWKPILGISLLVQSITFVVLCILNVEKKKNLATVFGIFGALGGATGAVLLYSEYKDRKALAEFDEELFDEFDEFIDDYDELEDGIDEDEILCTFESKDAE